MINSTKTVAQIYLEDVIVEAILIDYNTKCGTTIYLCF